mgnify:CR=1 FL=1
MRPERVLGNFSLGFFIYAAAAALVSILAGWPAQFGGAGDPDKVGIEFVSRGTAIAPPLVPLLVLGGGALLVRRGRHWSTLGAVVLLLLGVLFVIGGIGEAFAPSPVTAPRAALVIGGVLAAGGGAVLVGLSLAALIAKFRGRNHPDDAESV